MATVIETTLLDQSIITTEYSLFLIAYTGKITDLSDFIELEYSRPVNDVGQLVAVVKGSLPRSTWDPDSRLEVWRGINGGQMILETETQWIIKKIDRIFTANGVRYWRIEAHSLNVILRSRIVAYNANTAGAFKTEPADDFMKSVVYDNFGAGAVTGRNISTHLSIATDVSAASSVAKAIEYRPVMDVLKELADTSMEQGIPLYFDIVMDTHTLIPVFTTYAYQRGADHRSTDSPTIGQKSVILGPDYNNIGEFTISEDYSEEATYIYAIGPGSYGIRPIVVAEDTSRSSRSPFSRIERMINGNNLDTLESDAQAELNALRPRITAEGQVLYSPSSVYGLHWSFGDRMTFQDEDYSFDCRVDAIRVSVRGGVQSVEGYFRSDT